MTDTIRLQLPCGWLSEEEASALWESSRAITAEKPVIVEVGSWVGKSSVVLGSSLLDRPGGRLFCVDPWDARGDPEYPKHLKTAEITVDQLFDVWWNNVCNAGLEKLVIPLRGTTKDYAKLFDDGSVDMVFIDGDHSVEWATIDITSWAPKLKPGGVMAIHDIFLPPFREVVGYDSRPLQALLDTDLTIWDESAPMHNSLIVLTKKCHR